MAPSRSPSAVIGVENSDSELRSPLHTHSLARSVTGGTVPGVPRFALATTVSALAVAGCSYPNPDFDLGAMTSGTASSTSLATTSSGATAATGEATGTASTGGEDSTTTSTSASTSTDDTASDGSPCAGLDWTVVTWEPIEPVNTEFNEYQPFLLADGRTLLFSSHGTWAHSDILAAVRSAPGDPFVLSPHDMFYGLNTDHDEFRVELSNDGLRAYFSSIRLGQTMKTDVFFAERPDVTASFGDPVPVIEGPDHDHDPHLTDDELALYYAPVVDGQHDLWWTTRSSTREPFAPPQVLADLNMPGLHDKSPSLSRDQLILVFASLRAGAGDIFVSRRGSTSEPFVAPVAAPAPINDPDALDSDPFLADDHGLCELFWISERRGGAGGADLFRAVLEPIP